MTTAINLAMALLVGPLFAGIIRKVVRARVHSRQGPPIWQPYFDLFKLLGKEDLRSSTSPVALYGPMVALAAILVAALLTPMGLIPPLANYGDMIVFAYFVTIVAVAAVMVGLSSSSPYSSVGAGREIMMHIVVEPVLIISLVTAAVKAESFMMWDIATWYEANAPTASMVVAAVALLIALQAQVGKLPFDIVEADQEIMGGPFVELSGPRLALFHWASFARQIVYASVLVAIFVPWGIGFVFPWNLAAHILKLAAVIAIIGLVDVVNPRLRIDQAMLYFAVVIILGLVGLGLALAGF
ncbi:MAG: respiratory chain complex I subunit 1 family protein [Armatimonadota bacterium]